MQSTRSMYGTRSETSFDQNLLFPKDSASSPFGLTSHWDKKLNKKAPKPKAPNMHPVTTPLLLGKCSHPQNKGIKYPMPIPAPNNIDQNTSNPHKVVVNVERNTPKMDVQEPIATTLWLLVVGNLLSCRKSSKHPDSHWSKYWIEEHSSGKQNDHRVVTNVRVSCVVNITTNVKLNVS